MIDEQRDPTGDERVWFEPGLLRRVEAHRAARPPRPERRPPWWRRMRLTAPSTRWTAEGTLMVFLAVCCITLTVAITMSITGRSSTASSPAAAGGPLPAPTPRCIAVPIPYSSLPRCA